MNVQYTLVFLTLLFFCPGTHTSTFLAGVGGVLPGGTPENVSMNPVTGELGSSVVPAILDYMVGLELTQTGVETVTLGPGACRNSDNTFNIVHTTTTVANLSVSGVGGLDTGSEEKNTWYAVLILGDSTGVNAPNTLLSLSGIAPTLPVTHDKFRRCGWVRNNGASNLQPFLMTFRQPSRIVFWQMNALMTGTKVLDQGSNDAWDNANGLVDLSPLLPPMINSAYFTCVVTETGGNSASFVSWRIPGLGGSTDPSVNPYLPLVGSGGTGNTISGESFLARVSPTRTLEFAAGNIGDMIDLYVNAYIDHL